MKRLVKIINGWRLKWINTTLFVLILAHHELGTISFAGINFGASQIKEDLASINFGAKEKMS